MRFDGFVGGDDIGQREPVARELGERAVKLENTAPGVFAVGDVRSGSIKRVALAVGERSMAVRLVHKHLAFHG